MAPRRGGGGGSSGSGSGSSSSPSCGTSDTYPCTTELNFMYGRRARPLWSEAENYGQLIMACIWAVVLLILFFCLVRASNRSRKPLGAPAPVVAHPGQHVPVPTTPPKTKEMRGSGWVLQTGILLFLISFIFLAVRYGIISSQANVLVGYRFESSVVVLLQRLAVPLIFYGLYQLATPPSSSRLLGLIKVPYLLLLAAYTILNIAYLILDFLISASSLESFKYGDSWSWRLGDRDFALTMNNGMIEALKMNAFGTGFAPGSIRVAMYDDDDDPAYLDNRWIQVKIGVAADALAVALALVFLGLVVVAFVFGGSGVHKKGRRMGLLLLAGIGMLLSTMFALIVTGYFVYPNMVTITTVAEWFSFIWAYEESEPDYYGLTDYIPPANFLPSYRATVNGFPVVQALLWPLGIAVACLAAVVLVSRDVKDDVKSKEMVQNGGLYYAKGEERLG
ncbi:hypothetical protein V8F20_010847 [Naviculisporaceae sp. PSN 640]